MIVRRRTIVAKALILALSGLPLGAAVAAPAFPHKPVRIVVPFAAGTAPDFIARMLAEQLQPRWQQPVVVENRVGASGNIGTEHVARAPADGHTLLVSPPPPLAINRFLFKSLDYRPSDLAIVTVVASVPNVLVAKPTIPVSDVAGLMSMAAAAPRQLSYASTGKGGTPHLTMEWLMSAAGFELVHVPYAKGLAPALNDLLGGHVDLMFANLSDARPHVESGKLKALGVASAEPISVLPGVPPISRVVPGLLAETWYAMAAPGETPPDIIAKIASDVTSVLANPLVAERFRALSLTPVANSPGDATAFVAAEAKRWQNVIETIGLKPE